MNKIKYFTIILIVTIAVLLLYYKHNAATEYYNAYQKIKFTIPTGWSVSKDYMDDNSYKLGQFQLFNYIVSSNSKGFAKGQNKIEGMIISSQNSSTSTTEDSVYTPKSKKEEIVMISGNKVNSKTEVFDGGITIKTYMLPIYKNTGSYLSLSIYGDVANFNMLDLLAKQILDNYTKF